MTGNGRFINTTEFKYDNPIDVAKRKRESAHIAQTKLKHKTNIIITVRVGVVAIVVVIIAEEKFECRHNYLQQTIRQ